MPSKHELLEIKRAIKKKQKLKKEKEKDNPNKFKQTIL